MERCLPDAFDRSQSSWEHATLTVYGGAGDDVLSIREIGGNDAYGVLIDNVQITKDCHNDPVLKVTHVWGFENATNANGSAIAVGQFAAPADLKDWVNNGANKAEVAHVGYGAVFKNEDGSTWGAGKQKQWLDSAASAGNISIATKPIGDLLTAGETEHWKFQWQPSKLSSAKTPSLSIRAKMRMIRQELEHLRGRAHQATPFV